MKKQIMLTIDESLYNKLVDTASTRMRETKKNITIQTIIKEIVYASFINGEQIKNPTNEIKTELSQPPDIIPDTPIIEIESKKNKTVFDFDGIEF